MFSARSILLFVSLFIGLQCFTQNHTVQFICSDSVILKKYTALELMHVNKTQVKENVIKILSNVKANGFVTASVDSVLENDTITKVYVYLGEKYTFKHIDLPTELVDSFLSTPLETLPQSILNYYQNNGYPFAKISFDDVIFDNSNQIQAKLKVDKGYLYKLDSIRILGNLNISNNFLSHYLQLPTKSNYNQSIINEINYKLQQLNFVQIIQPSQISMLNTGYLVNLYANAKKVNRFDVIFGLLPNNTQTNGKLLFTVDANIGLVNAFAKGETISLMWQQIQPQSPRVDIGFAMPYVFKSNAQFNFKFNLYKRDSAYLNLNTDLGLSYTLNSTSKFGFFFNNFSGRIITADTLYVIQTKTLPSFLDVNIANLGFEYNYQQKLINKKNINTGFDIRVVASFGNKTIKENIGITSIKANNYNYKNLYDSIEKNTYQLKLKLLVNYYLALGKYSTLKISGNTGVIQTTRMLQNEQFQIGGFKLLRGFDEENIFTNKYLVSSLEYRYSINSKSYFYIFNDLGFTNNSIIHQNYNFTSAGLGIALNTKQGMLNFCLAGGKRNDLDFNFRNTKIHIGLLNNF